MRHGPVTDGRTLPVVLFDVRIIDDAGIPTARVVGDVDIATLPQLKAGLDRLDGAETAIDLRSVDWFDPVCLGALVAANLKAQRRDARLTILASGAVEDLLAESGLDGVLELRAR